MMTTTTNIQDIQFIILSYNHPEITSRCVRNCLKSVNPKQLSLFHNGSQPKFVQQLKNEFPQINHICESTNTGFSGGANRALLAGFQKSNWIFFITNDTEIIELPTEFTLEPGLYAPLIWDRKKIKWDSLGAAIHLSQARLRHIKSDDDQLSYNEKFYVPGTAFLIHKSIFDKLNGFDETYETFWEDVDFSLRCQDSGLHIGTTKDFKLSHLGGKTCHKDSHYTLYLYQRNRWKLMLRIFRLYKLSKSQLALTYIFDFFRLNIFLIRQQRWQDCRQLARAFSQL